MSSSILTTSGRAAALSACAAAVLLLVATAQDASAASATISSTKMLSILKAPTADFAVREQSAPPQIKSQLMQLRQQFEGKPFTMGYTSAMDLPLDALAGTRIPQTLPAAPQVAATGDQLYKLDIQSAKMKAVDLKQLYLVQCSASYASFDWRKHGKVTPVKSQICGTCWDFTAMGAYEGSYAIRNKAKVDTSEQYNLNCHNAGSCAGGWWMPVFEKMITTGTATEAAVPFTGNDGAACPAAAQTPYKATAWSLISSNPDLKVRPTVAQMKSALCAHGPLATAVMVDNAFQAYTGGTFVTGQSYNWINHGVVIVGWDDAKQAWLIKNSWGTNWGETGGYGAERGYMWIGYNTNNIGVATAWVDARSSRWDLIVDWRKLVIARYKIDPDPGPLKTKLLTQPSVLEQVQPTAEPAAKPLLKQQILKQPLLVQPE
jgi:cathepsin L